MIPKNVIIVFWNAFVRCKLYGCNILYFILTMGIVEDLVLTIFINL